MVANGSSLSMPSPPTTAVRRDVQIMAYGGNERALEPVDAFARAGVGAGAGEALAHSRAVKGHPLAVALVPAPDIGPGGGIPLRGFDRDQ